MARDSAGSRGRMAKGDFKQDDDYAISRCRDAGWEVVLMRRGKRLRTTLWDHAHGGPEASLIAAREWRDRQLKQHPPRRRAERAQQLVASNKSGVSGVSFERAPDGSIRCWNAKTSLGPGKVLKRSFSVGKYGEAARELAIAERTRQLEQVKGLMAVHPAEALLRLRAHGRSATASIDEAPPDPKVRRNNRSGVTGVAYKRGHRDHPGYWIAQTAIQGLMVTKAYSIERHGHDHAFSMAVQERAAQLARKRALQADGSASGSTTLTPSAAHRTVTDFSK